MPRIWIYVIAALGVGALCWIAIRDQAPSPDLTTSNPTTDSQPASHSQAASPAPASIPVPPAQAPETTQLASANLWTADDWTEEFSEEGFRLYRTEANLTQLQNLAIGTQLELSIPNLQTLVSSKLTNSRMGINGTRVWSGEIDGEDAMHGLSIVQGRLDTHMTVITNEGTWTVVIDNQTGRTTLVDERERVQHQVLADEDGVEHPQPSLPEPPKL